MNPIEKYHKRYLEIKAEKSISADKERILELLEKDTAGLNNFFMAALGMSTLILRLGAVIQLCRKYEKLDDQGDMFFSKQLLDNLREILPSDDNWRKMWEISTEDNTWRIPTVKLGQKEPLLNRFVTFRNDFVHQKIELSETYLNQLQAAIQLFEEMEQLNTLFQPGELVLIENQYHWKEGTQQTNLHPYFQVGENSEQPYIFQGVHNKEKVELLNTQLGDKIDQNIQDHINPLFEPILQSLRNGAGQWFDHSSRISSYQSCFFGREKESEKLLDFCKSQDEQNILTVKSPAGMGKGALMADLIEQLKVNKIQALYHFCGAGLHNNLHAILYHLILQGKNSSYWKTESEEIKRKLERLPSKYIDTIHLFQRLLNDFDKVSKVDRTETIKKLERLNNFDGLLGFYDSNGMEKELIETCNRLLAINPTHNRALHFLKNGTTIKPKKNLTIILDALDEAQVASSQLKISDWFYTYNEKEEPEADWRSASNIRWVFTYRCAEDGSENFYKFPKMKQLATLEELQPLKGLSQEAAQDAFRKFKVSEDFMEAVIKKAAL